MLRRERPPDAVVIDVATSLGRIGIAVSDKGLVGIDLGHRGSRPLPKRGGFASPFAGRAIELVMRYAAGENVLFDVPLDLEQATAFQKAVWRAAAAIPYGETRTYAWVAKRIKRPKAVRAVGQALGANPLPIIIPCHRVISSSGALGGFSSGLTMKKRLLAREAGKKDRAGAPEGKRSSR